MFAAVLFDAVGLWLESSVLARLFLIIALGYLLGDLRLPGNFRFGVAAVLFVGLAFGAWNPAFKLPEEIQSLGLVLFVYCVGLQAAPGFFQSLKREGLALNAPVLLTLLVGTVAAVAMIRLGGLPAPLIAGLFCGSLTNTAALGAATDAATQAGFSQTTINQAVIGYGLAYPLAILVILALIQARVAWGRREPAPSTTSSAPRAMTLEVGPGAPAASVGDLGAQFGVMFTRARWPDGQSRLLTPAMTLPAGTLVIAVGPPANLASAVAALGRESAVRLQEDSKGYELHRYFVSNKELVGRPIRELGVENAGGVISRVARGDVDLPVNGSTVLHLGDRVRVVSTPAREKEVRKFFGNSLTVLAETGYLSFAVGIVLGLALGAVAIPIPGLSQPIRLGVAGGGLIAALILGRLGRTGPFIWNLPFEVNLALRQLGILFFLAAVGVKAGGGLVALIDDEGAGKLVLLAVALTAGSHLLLIGLLWLFGKRSAAAVVGTMCGFQTQPAALTFAASRTEVAWLNPAYATVYPLALVAKIILAQVLIFL